MKQTLFRNFEFKEIRKSNRETQKTTKSSSNYSLNFDDKINPETKRRT